MIKLLFHKHRSFSRLLCICNLMLLVPLAAVAQYRNTISGFVFTPDRRPIANVPVELTNDVYQVLGRTRTDGTGRFLFGGISSGKFIIKVLPLGTNFEEQSQEIELISFPRPGGGSTSDSAHKDFYLRSRKNATDIRGVKGAVYVQEVPKEAKRLYDRAVIELGESKSEAGIQSLLDALKLFPDYYSALEILGVEYIKKQNYEYARAVFIKAVSVNDRSFASWYGLAYAAYALKENSIAIEAATKATVLDQSSLQAFLILGISYRQAKEYKKAEDALLEAKKLANGQSSDVHWNLALLYGNNMKKYKEAANELDEYVKIAPANANLDEVRKLINRFREMAATQS